MSAALSLPNPIDSRKQALEALLRQRRLQKDAPPLRGEDRRLRPLALGVTAIDSLLGGGFPRGQLSEMHGSTSSGRTALALALFSRITQAGGLVALVDPLDRFDPASADAAGVDLTRLLWLRGPRDDGSEPKVLADASAAVATLAGSGLFELVAFDVAGASRAVRALPSTTWLRLQRLVEEMPTGLVLVADTHVACGPGGVSLALEPAGVRWSGAAAGRMLDGLTVRARAGRHGSGTAEITLSAAA